MRAKARSLLRYYFLFLSLREQVVKSPLAYFPMDEAGGGGEIRRFDDCFVVESSKLFVPLFCSIPCVFPSNSSFFYF